jgi:hypothetical protein
MVNTANKVEIDWTRCDGHGLCATLLPDDVALDEWGFPSSGAVRSPPVSYRMRAAQCWLVRLWHCVSTHLST